MAVAASDTNLHVCSFSGHPDAIGQWQRYGGNGSGYCIGFDANLITTDILSRAGVTLQRMIYRVDEQEMMTRLRIEQLYAHFGAYISRTDLGLSTEELKERAGARISVELEETALQLKHPLFADENEWRLIKKVGTGPMAEKQPTILFAPRGEYVKPFIEIELYVGKADVGKLPVSHVICGPKLDGDLAITCARQFLENCGYPDVRTAWSETHKIWR